MNINATILVQAGNFYIAYLLFRYILLELGYEVLQQKQAHQASLEDMILRDTQAITKERQRQRETWREFRVWSSEYRPQGVDSVLFFRGLTTTSSPQHVSSAQKEKVRAQLVDTMMHALKERYE